MFAPEVALGELALESVLVVVAELVFESVGVPASVGLAAESVAADESAGAGESELRVDPTSGI